MQKRRQNTMPYEGTMLMLLLLRFGADCGLCFTRFTDDSTLRLFIIFPLLNCCCCCCCCRCCGHLLLFSERATECGALVLSFVMIISGLYTITDV